ncbi:MAG: hypothetical protein IPP96_13165 [Chitinophagaceae bacterium]|nr:hypothetical protein [Chitinophagaceae bacterium]
MKTSNLLLIVLAGSLVLSCNSTKITSSWKAGDAVTKTYHNIMVWGILTEKDSILKENMEAHLVNDLVDKGYHAISSVTVFGARSYKKLTEKEIVDQFKNSGVDAVITIALLDKQKEELYVPPGMVNNMNSYDHVDKYYSDIYEKVFTPGYYVSTTNYFWESNLFEVTKDKLVYSARTRSFDPSSSNMLAHENGLLLIKDMVKKKVIIDPVKKD